MINAKMEWSLFEVVFGVIIPIIIAVSLVLTGDKTYMVGGVVIMTLISMDTGMAARKAKERQ